MESQKPKAKSRKLLLCGQSLVEVIVAVAIFVIIAGSSVVAVLGSLSTSRLGEEETQATAYAVEGIEAVRSIRNKSWEDLTDGNHGLSGLGGAWTFLDTSEELDKFTRVVKISSVERNENDEIVTSGVVVDLDTKRVISQVSWDFTPARTNTVEVVSYLTNWQEARKVASCSEYCEIRSYSAGVCRRNAQVCTSNGERYKSGGDIYCTGGPQEDTCCCAP